MSEELLIRQGAPTLAGIKTGSLFPCACVCRATLLTEIRRINRTLTPKGLCLLPLRIADGRALLYLYRPARLSRDLQDSLAAELLRRAGYPEGGCAKCLAQLIRRFRAGEEFPHEVGLSSAIRPRMCAALSSTGTTAANAPGFGRCTAMKRTQKGFLPNTANARRSTARSGRPAPIWSGWPSQSDRVFQKGMN